MLARLRRVTTRSNCCGLGRGALVVAANLLVETERHKNEAVAGKKLPVIERESAAGRQIEELPSSDMLMAGLPLACIMKERSICTDCAPELKAWWSASAFRRLLLGDWQA